MCHSRLWLIHVGCSAAVGRGRDGRFLLHRCATRQNDKSCFWGCEPGTLSCPLLRTLRVLATFVVFFAAEFAENFLWGPVAGWWTRQQIPLSSLRDSSEWQIQLLLSLPDWPEWRSAWESVSIWGLCGSAKSKRSSELAFAAPGLYPPPGTCLTELLVERVERQDARFGVRALS